MKKFGLLIASILIAGVTSAYADQDKIACPSTWDVREYGSKFTHAFIHSHEDESALWVLTSEPFSQDGNIWQTTYRLKMDSVNDPVTAVSQGQQYFNKSAMSAYPINNGTSQDGVVYCFYEPEGSNYLITVTNGVNYGLKRKS